MQQSECYAESITVFLSCYGHQFHVNGILAPHLYEKVASEMLLLKLHDFKD